MRGFKIRSVWWAMALTAGLARAEEPAAPVTLEQCIQAAWRNNPDLEAGLHRVQAARERAYQADSAYYPLATLSTSWSRTDNPPQAFMMELNQRSLDMANPMFNPNEPDDTENIRFSAGAQYRLFDGGRRALDSGLARGGADMQAAQWESLRNELAHEVTRAFIQVLLAGSHVDLQAQSVASMVENVRVARERHAAGAAVEADVLHLEVKLAEAREAHIRARHGAKLAVAALNAAVGVDLLRDAGQAQAVEAPAEEPDYDAIRRAGAAGRPERAVMRNALHLREKGYQRARREYAPTVEAFASLDWDSDKLSGFEQSYIVGVQAQWALFDGFRRKHAVREAAAEWAGARAEERKLETQLSLDLTQAVLMAEEAAERVAVARASVNLAEEALRSTRARYEAGAADVTELITAQWAWTATQTRRLAAEYDVIAARSNVDRARGVRGLVFEMQGELNP
jgi:outer membrane protein